MYNILLTDDEQIVIDSLSFIINKNFEGQVKVHTALSGTKALETVTNENIDIIFMDINMPGLSGLETVSCITKIKPGAVIIILSAFDRFQYAQEAMNLGAFKYITKPVNRNVVIQTIRSAMDFIDAKRGKLSADQELHKKLDLVSPMIESDFIYSCIYNNDKSVDLSSYLDYFNLTGTPWCFCCFEIPNINSSNQYETYLKIRELLNEDHRCLVSTFMMNRIIIFYPVFSNPELQNEIYEQIKAAYTNLCYSITSGIRAGVSNINDDLSQLSSSYAEALSALNKTDKAGGIVFANQTPNSALSPQDNAAEFKKQIFIKLRQGDSSGVKSYINLYCNQLQNAESDLNKIKNHLFEIIVTAQNIATEINSKYSNHEFSNAFSTLMNENDFNMLKDYLQKMLMEFVTAVQSVKVQVENPIITKVCEYIEKNMEKDISLEQVAEFAGVSSFYLSKLFKEEKGVTFINFLTDTRLDKAQQLLKDNSISIKEITAAIGYNDQNYFSRLFKNKFGISPTEYRNTL